jgi:hypothetical protein
VRDRPFRGTRCGRERGRESQRVESRRDRRRARRAAGCTSRGRTRRRHDRRRLPRAPDLLARVPVARLMERDTLAERRRTERVEAAPQHAPAHTRHFTNVDRRLRPEFSRDRRSPQFESIRPAGATRRLERLLAGESIVPLTSIIRGAPRYALFAFSLRLLGRQETGTISPATAARRPPAGNAKSTVFRENSRSQMWQRHPTTSAREGINESSGLPFGVLFSAAYIPSPAPVRPLRSRLLLLRAMIRTNRRSRGAARRKCRRCPYRLAKCKVDSRDLHASAAGSPPRAAAPTVASR